MLTQRFSAIALVAVVPLASCGDSSAPATNSSAPTSGPSASTKASATATSSASSASTTANASSSAQASEPPAPPPGPRPSDDELKQLTKANNALAFALWSKVGPSKGDFSFSPCSIESALTMTWLGAKGDTAAQMKKVLGFETGASAAADITGRYEKSLGGPVTVHVANRLFGEKTYSFESAFLGATEKDFGAGLDGLDFKGATEPSRMRIDQWVADRTEDRIKELVPKGGVSADTRLMLVNAIYFLGDWATPFEKELTRTAAFHTSATAQHDVPMMNQKLYASFAEDNDVSVVDLGYKGGDFSMMLVLPKKVDGLDAVEKKLSFDEFGKWIGAEAESQVSVSLPKFTVDQAQSVDLATALEGIGMTDAFSLEKADFTAMANPPNPADRLYISNVFHKAFVKVDEKGTEAAAATAVGMKEDRAMPQKPLKLFVADHPFLFFLRDAKSNTILFAGRVADPVTK